MTECLDTNTLNTFQQKNEFLEGKKALFKIFYK